MKEITIEIFHAASELDLWNEYSRGHASVLEHFGVKNLKSYNSQPCEHPMEYVITARNMDGALMGGIRVQPYHPSFNLPVVQALESLDPKVNEIILATKNKGICEPCGLWIARDHGRLGLAHYLLRSAIAISTQIDCTIIYGICSPFSVNILISLGYIVMNQVGNNGTYLYPTPEFISTMMVIPDTIELEYAEKEHRETIYHLRKFPQCTLTHTHKTNVCDVHYNLLIPFSLKGNV